MITLAAARVDTWSALMERTPRELAGAMTFHAKGRKREVAELLSLHAQAARGDPKKLEKLIKDLQRE